MISKIKKRDGRVVEFDSEKIYQAIWKAAESVEEENEEKIKLITQEVIKHLENDYKKQIPTVENIQDTVEKTLLEQDDFKTAKAFILYRQKRKEFREAKSLMGIEDDCKFPLNALKVMEGRYLQKDNNGNLIETPRQMLERVAHAVAKADSKYN